MFEFDTYTSRLLLAIFVVAIVPYLGAKVYTLWLEYSKLGRQKVNLNDLIRREMLRLNGIRDLLKKQPYREHKAQDRRSHAFIFYEKLIESSQGSKRIELEKTYQVLNILNGDETELSKIQKAIHNLSKLHIPKREVINALGEITKDEALFSTPIKSKVLKDIVESYCLWESLYIDAKKESSTFSKILEKTKKYKSTDIYLGIMLIFFLKSGSSEKRIYEQAIQNREALKKRFKLIPENQIRKSILNLSKTHQANEILHLIKMQMKSYEKFSTEYIEQKRFEENKRKEKQQKSSSRKTKRISGLDKAYEILGANRSDTLSSIKKKYHKLAMKYHPDKLGNMSDNELKEANDKFAEIKNAFDEVMSSKGSRAA